MDSYDSEILICWPFKLAGTHQQLLIHTPGLRHQCRWTEPGSARVATQSTHYQWTWWDRSTWAVVLHQSRITYISHSDRILAAELVFDQENTNNAIVCESVRAGVTFRAVVWPQWLSTTRPLIRFNGNRLRACSKMLRSNADRLAGYRPHSKLCSKHPSRWLNSKSITQISTRAYVYSRSTLHAHACNFIGLRMKCTGNATTKSDIFSGRIWMCLVDNNTFIGGIYGTRRLILGFSRVFWSACNEVVLTW